MAENTDPDFSNWAHSGRRPSRPSLTNSVKLKAFLNTLPAGRLLARKAAPLAETAESCPGGELEMASSYWARCSERIAYACSVEDAIFWHTEIINEFSVEMHTTRVKPWPTKLKSEMIKYLEDSIQRHSKAVERLTGIVQRNEQLNWLPGNGEV